MNAETVLCTVDMSIWYEIARSSSEAVLILLHNNALYSSSKMSKRNYRTFKHQFEPLSDGVPSFTFLGY